jgi:hypothetical protein
MKYYALSLLLLLGLPACKHASKNHTASNKEDSKDHIGPAKMGRILTDIHFAEAYSSMVKDSLHKGNAKNIDSLAHFYKSIFAHYNISQQQFDESMEWYRQHPEELDTAYAHVMTDLNKPQLKVK